MRHKAIGFGDTAEEAIKDWRNHTLNHNTVTWLESKGMEKPTRVYGRRWSIPYEEKL